MSSKGSSFTRNVSAAKFVVSQSALRRSYHVTRRRSASHAMRSSMPSAASSATGYVRVPASVFSVTDVFLDCAFASRLHFLSITS